MYKDLIFCFSHQSLLSGNSKNAEKTKCQVLCYGCVQYIKTEMELQKNIKTKLGENKKSLPLWKKGLGN